MNIQIDPAFHLLEKLRIFSELGIAEFGYNNEKIYAQCEQLQAVGCPLTLTADNKFRLEKIIDVINPTVIINALNEQQNLNIDHLIFHVVTDSTNTVLKTQVNLHEKAICLAEYQTHGRGRRGNVWQAPFAANINLSIALPITLPSLLLNKLPLVVGISIWQELCSLGIQQAQIKWPNDIMIDKCKVGGILVELNTISGNDYQVIIGVGLNIYTSKFQNVAIDQSWTDVVTWLPNQHFSRNQLIVKLIQRINENLLLFVNEKFDHFNSLWQQADMLQGKMIELHRNLGQIIEGKVIGISTLGELLLQHGQEISKFNSGDVHIKRF